MKDNILSELAEVLRNRRKELNLTQEELAEKVGKKRTYIASRLLSWTCVLSYPARSWDAK